MATGVVSWSQTPDNNASSDHNVYWAEGQAPSSVNNSARALMASVARYRDDNAGSLLTTGTSTAYVIPQSNQQFTSLAAMHGQSLRIKFHTTNGLQPTLNVDGYGAKFIAHVYAAFTPVGSIIGNSIHDVVYDNVIGNWILVDYFQEFVTGTRMLFQQPAAPTGWTRDPSAFNDHALRVSTGTVTTGGTAPFTSVFAARGIAHENLPIVNFALSGMTFTDGALSSTTITNGTEQWRGSNLQSCTAGAGHSVPAGAVKADISVASPTVTGTITGGVAASGGNGVPLNFAVNYVDVLIATKD